MSSISAKNEERMANGPVVKTVLALGIPTFVAQFVNLLYNIVDRIYIGHIKGEGALALTGVGLCIPILALISAFSSLFGSGGVSISWNCLWQGR